jgi:histone H3/H4
MAEEFTLASMRRLLRKHGDLRISDGSAEELRHAVGEYGSKVAEAAVAHALEEGRKTVLNRDIRAVIEATIGGSDN